jgi:thioredoxin 1
MAKTTASARRSKRRTRLAINLGGSTEFRELEDGTWAASFAELDVRGSGASKDAAFTAMREALDDKVNNDEAAMRTFQQWASDNIIEQEITEEQYQQELAERRKQKRYPSSALPQLTPETFDEAISSATPTLVDYWAAWCEPCHAMAPVLHEVKDTMDGELRVFGVDVEAHEELWERFDLKGIPTLIVFRDGREQQRILGTRSVDELLREIRSGCGPG